MGLVVDQNTIVRRSDGWVFRWFRGDVLAVAPDGERSRISGAGALVWMALDEPADLGALGHRIGHGWPDLGPLDGATIAQAVEVLVDAGAVVAMSAGDG